MSTIRDLFEAQASRAPASVALHAGDQQVTYRELNRRARRLARHLRRAGVAPETRVGVCLPRLTDMVTAWLGVLEAGGAYVPLDAAYPPERLSLMIEEAGVSVVITEDLLAAALMESAEADSPDARNAAETAAAADMPAAASPDNLACLFFTSGSTGRPKAVAITHRSVVVLLRDTNYVSIDEGDRVAQMASPSFDAATFEIWGALLNGARVVHVRTDMTVTAIAAQLEGRAITTAFITTALFNQIVRAAPRAFASMRTLLVGGEPLDPVSIRKVLEDGPPARLLNAYGPTETTTFAAWHPIASAPDDAPRIPIGRPIRGTRLHVLDNGFQPVAPETPGELFIGGDGLARGYWASPSLTASRFVPDPFGPTPGARLYRTGDRARCLADGTVDVLGRRDRQVKIRGFRIEPAEVELTLRRHQDVAHAAVVARDDGGDRRLVAYLVPARAHVTPTTTELREYLGARLPEYMLPAAFVWIDRFPLTPNGKVALDRLPAPGTARPDLATEYVPIAAEEARLADIWQSLLGLSSVGARDNFFELGGHSLLATQLVSRIRDAFGQEISLRDVFAAPTIRSLSARLARDRADASAPASAWESATATASASSSSRVMAMTVPGGRTRPDALPPSYPQERVWFLEQLVPGNLAYNFQAAVWLRGSLDVAVLARALTEIVRRHEMLRTTVYARDDRPWLRVHEPWRVILPIVDLRAIAIGRREAAVTRGIRIATRHRFDPGMLPLIRWTLFRTADDEHALLQVEHHLVHDGWSLAVLLQELKALYASFAAGQPSPLPDLPVQFADYVLWQREWLQGGQLQRQLQFWTARLAGSPPLLRLPADRHRPARQTLAGRAVRVELPHGLYEQLRACSRRQGTTHFVTLLTAFCVLLQRYSGQRDLVVGSTVANRRVREAEPLIGMLVNSVALRIDLSGRPTLREALGRVQAMAMDAYDHQDLPFERLVEALRPERDPSRNPIFQAMFSFHDSPVPELDFAGLRGVVVEQHSGSSKFDLNVTVIPRAEQRLGRDARSEAPLALLWEYSTALFHHDSMTRMIGHFRTLLESIAADTSERAALRPVSELTLLDARERDMLLAGWNATAAGYPDRPIHRLVAEQAARTPDAIAAVARDTALSYGELWRRSRALARRLAPHLAGSAGPDRLAAVCVDRSVDMVVTLLGLLETGGAYVPMDPDHPAERLRLMLEDSRASVLITQRALLDRFPLDAGPRIVIVDHDEEDDAAQAEPAEQLEQAGAAAPVWRRDSAGRREIDAEVDAEIDTNSLAYVLYTSGSTGRPKGVAIPHRALTNVIVDFARRLTPGGGDVLVGVTTLSFDIAALEIYLPLMTGARLVIASHDTASDGYALARELTACGATMMQATPATWRMLIGSGWSGRRGFTALCGGEALAPGLAVALRERVDAVWNVYGPTETTIWSSASRVHVDGDETVPVGRPIANTTFYVVDDRHEPSPINVPGELLIGGAGVARGYWCAPALTADRFVPNAFDRTAAEARGSRVYRTGDRARYRADGTLEVLGRLDDQVKVRGFRVEPREVEAVLDAHESVRETVVVARHDQPGDTRLVAYIVPRGDRAAEDVRSWRSELRRAARERLPDYMVPDAFVWLPELPRTPNGKVDRAALPAPAVQPDRVFVAPRTPVETALAAIWREVLGAGEIGMDDDFFDLGGHSLLAMQVISRARRDLGMELPLHALFARPVLGDLAAEIARRLETEAAHAQHVQP